MADCDFLLRVFFANHSVHRQIIAASNRTNRRRRSHAVKASHEPHDVYKLEPSVDGMGIIMMFGLISLDIDLGGNFLRFQSLDYCLKIYFL